MNRWLLIIPAIVLVAFAIIGGQQLFAPEKPDFTRIERSAPNISFETLGGGSLKFSETGESQPIAVNLFASWCAPCEVEHPKLLEIAAQRPGQLYGVLYKDKVENGQAFINRLGNPFTDIALDQTGQGGLDFGLTGVPETFVISPEGTIILHVRGPLTDATTQDVVDALGQ